MQSEDVLALVPSKKRLAWSGLDLIWLFLAIGAFLLAGVLVGEAADIRHPPSLIPAVLIVVPATLLAMAVLIPLVVRLSSIRTACFLSLGGLALAYGNFRAAGPPARVDVEIRTHLQSVASALEMYAADHGVFPTDVRRLEPGYLRSADGKPPVPFIYTVTRVGDRFTLVHEGKLRSREGDGPWRIQEHGRVEVSGVLKPR